MQDRSNMENLNKYERKKVLAVALFVGELMLKNGAEIYRVEDTIRRICNSRGLHYVTAFVTPTVIMIGDDRTDGYSFMKRISSRTTNFERIAEVNALSREFVEGKISIDELAKELRKASSLTSYSNLLRICCCSVASAMFVYLFGGDLFDMISGMLISFVAVQIGFVLERYEVNSLLLNMLSSVFVAIAAVFLYKIGFGKRLDMIIAGSIMPLLPGISLTNGIRDFINGDLLSGTSRMFEALMIAVSIAVSIGSVLGILYRLGGIS